MCANLLVDFHPSQLTFLLIIIAALGNRQDRGATFARLRHNP